VRQRIPGGDVNGFHLHFKEGRFEFHNSQHVPVLVQGMALPNGDTIIWLAELVSIARDYSRDQ
jgi:gluconate kinase